jgi:hypothetical protein
MIPHQNRHTSVIPKSVRQAPQRSGDAGHRGPRRQIVVSKVLPVFGGARIEPETTKLPEDEPATCLVAIQMIEGISDSLR